jgi:hypothetical protein
MDTDERQSEELVIGFDVKSPTDSSVEAAALGKTVIATDAILRELHDEFAQDSEILVKARPFKQGSFEIPIEVTVVLLGALASFPILESMLKCLTEYFRFKRELKGLAPRIQDGKIVIENNQIEIDKIVVNLLDPANRSNKLIASAFEEIRKDDNITGFHVTRKTGTLAKVKREEFEYYGPSASEKRFKEVQTTEVLDVLGPIFDEKGKWTFRHKGKPIHANVSDERFVKKTVIQNGEPFRSGDKLRVELLVEQEYDEVAGVYVDKRYTVVKIRKHIKRTETGNLFE